MTLLDHPRTARRPRAGDGLVVDGLRAGHHDRPVVRDLRFSVAPGEIVLLGGPAGSGKSTTLLALAGHLPGTTGRATVAGLPLVGGNPRAARESLQLVMAGRSVHVGLSVAENLALAGIELAAVTELFPELSGLGPRRAGMLSPTEARMLAVARAVLARPRVALVDAPVDGLPPVAAYRVLDVLRRAVSDDGLAVLLADRGGGAVARVVTRTLLLRDGALGAGPG
jgi:branched-chain amino acid transport system ATP-binding protein